MSYRPPPKGPGAATFSRSFWGGVSGPQWKWGPLTARTPAGDPVTMRWCCNIGHDTVGHAKEHAAQMVSWIERYGR